MRGKSTIVCFGDGTNPGVLRASGVVAPRAIFITYGEHERCVSATMRHRVAFPDAPIYVRATTKAEVRGAAHELFWATAGPGARAASCARLAADYCPS